MRIAFGEFVLDLGTRELRRHGRPCALSPKAFELLRLLVANRPRALAKQELFDRLWPDVVVVEANLANLVGEIRAALGEDSRHPRFVRTLHRFGYAFAEGEPAAGEAAQTVPLVRLLWKGGRADLGEGEHLLGRDPGLELRLDADTVSRRHARLEVRAERIVLEDLGSKNGTFVGGERLRELRVLVDGDEFRLGSLRVRLRRIEPAPTTRTRRARD